MSYTVTLALHAIFAITKEKREERQEEVTQWITEHQEEFNWVEAELAKIRNEAKKNITSEFVREQYYAAARQFVNKHFNFADDKINYMTKSDYNLIIAAYLLFRLLSHPEWTQLVNDEIDRLCSDDLPYLIAEHMLSIDQVDDNLRASLQEWIPAMKANPDKVLRKEEKFTVLKGEFLVRSLFSVTHMRLCSSIKSLLDSLYKMTRHISVKKITDTELIIQVGATGSLKVVRPAFYDPALEILSLVNMVTDETILNNFKKHHFFMKMQYDLAYLKEHGIDVKAFSRKLYEITNKKTNCMWGEFPLSIFVIMDENEEIKRKLYQDYRDMNLIRSIQAFIEAGSFSRTSTFDMKQKMALVSCMKRMLEVLQIAAEKPLPTINDMFQKETFIANLKGCFLLTYDSRLNSQALFENIIKALEALNKKVGIWEKLWSDKLFDKLKKAKPVERDKILALSAYLKRKYRELLAAENKKKTIIINEKKKEKIKEIMREKQASHSSPSLALPSANSSSRRKKKVAQSPSLSLIKARELTDAEIEIDTFLNAARAAFAGDPNVKLEWVKVDGKVGHVRLNFAEMSCEFQIREKSNQKTPQQITLTPAMKDEFLTRYLPNLFRDQLKEVTVEVKDNGLCLTPKETRCSYPEEMQVTAFNFLHKNRVQIEQVKPDVALPINHKKLHAGGSIGQPAISLAPSAQKMKTVDKEEKTQAVSMPAEELVKAIFARVIESRFLAKMFNFIDVKDERNRLLVDVNLKAAACLSDIKGVQVDTYLVMRSIVAALQEKYGEDRVTISPDSLNPAEYGKEHCEMTLKGAKAKKEWERSWANFSPELTLSFAAHLEDQITIASLFKKLKSCEQSLEGYSEKQITITEPLQEKEKGFYKPYQQCFISKKQYACLTALFQEMEKINENMPAAKGDKSLSLALESRKFVCYHRIFHHLSYLFKKKKDQTNSLIMMTLRNIFRHGYLEIKKEFSQLLDELVATLMCMNGKMDAALLFSKQESGHVSFNVKQSMYESLLTHVGSFIQQASDHSIGKATEVDRRKLVDDLQIAIACVASSPVINQKQKELLTVAMMSRIGEVFKEAPYVHVYGKLGMHDEDLMVLHDQVDAAIYSEVCCSSNRKYKNK